MHGKRGDGRVQKGEILKNYEIWIPLEKLIKKLVSELNLDTGKALYIYINKEMNKKKIFFGKKNWILKFWRSTSAVKELSSCKQYFN